MDEPTPDKEKVLDQFDAVVRETMMRLHRSRGEREEHEYERAEWRAERAELETRANDQSIGRVQAAARSVREPLERAIGRIDRILSEALPEDEAPVSEDA